MGETSKAIGNCVIQKINYLEREMTYSKATLAQLRRGLGKTPGSIPDIWGITIEGIPDGFISLGSKPSKGEWAVHIALTLFAMHQQGVEKKMNSNEREDSLGGALRKLIKSEDDEIRIKRRFDALATSGSIEELSNHLRGLVQLLKGDGIPLNYGKLAEEIFLYQMPTVEDSIRLKWGRDFYKYRKKTDVEVISQPEQ